MVDIKYGDARLPDRFWSKVSMHGECWIWCGSINRTGYGQVAWRGRTRLAHRALYEELVRPLRAWPIEVLDHLCRNRACCNPDHLDVTTQSINSLRGIGPAAVRAAHAAVTRCPRGHEYTPENTRIQMVRGYSCRSCRACTRERNQTARRERVLAKERGSIDR